MPGGSGSGILSKKDVLVPGHRVIRRNRVCPGISAKRRGYPGERRNGLPGIAPAQGEICPVCVDSRWQQLLFSDARALQILQRFYEWPDLRREDKNILWDRAERISVLP